MSGSRKLWMVSSLFLLTGATALAAEVVLNRLLTYVFGYSYVATATVLAAYMAGLSAGAYLLGRIAARLQKPLLVYGCLELLIASYLMAVPYLFRGFQSGSLMLSEYGFGRPAWMAAVRFGLSFAFVFIPAFLMGGTLPILIRAFDDPEVLQLHLPLLYAINTLGGALGTLLGGYCVIPRLGLDGTLFACALMDACVGFTALAVSGNVERPVSHVPEVRETAVQDSWSSPASRTGLDAAAVCTLALIQGVLTFTLEVLWAHLIGTVIGVTVYAFCLMLTAILLGIGFGSLLIPLLRRWLRVGPLGLFIRAEVLLALAVFASLFVWDRFPSLIRLTLMLKDHLSFLEREAVRFGFVLALLMPATLAMGIALPCLTAALRKRAANAGGWVGSVYAANTLGAIIGSLGTGLLLLGRVSSQRLLMTAGVLALASGASALYLGRDRRFVSDGSLRFVLGGLAACGLAALIFPGWDLGRLTSGSHYYWHRWNGVGSGRIVYYREDPQSGFVTVHVGRKGFHTMQTNGKYEGNNGPAEFQDLFAMIGSLYVRHLDRAVLVGLGPGRTLALMHDLGYRHIDAVEYSPSIIAAARSHFPEFTRGILDDAARVSLVCDDGRAFLQLARPGYDLVTVAISGAAFAGVGNLYTREFFSLVRSRLGPGGVFLLWLQGHHVPLRELRSVVFTLGAEFPELQLYSTELGDQIFLIASQAPLHIDPVEAAKRSQGVRVRRALESAGMFSMIDLASLAVFTTREEIDAFTVATPGGGEETLLYTDFKPLFEYRTPWGLAQRIPGHDLRAQTENRSPSFQPPLEPGQEEYLLGRRALVGRSLGEAVRHLDTAAVQLQDPAWVAEAHRLVAMAH